MRALRFIPIKTCVVCFAKFASDRLATCSAACDRSANPSVPRTESERRAALRELIELQEERWTVGVDVDESPVTERCPTAYAEANARLRAL